MTGAPPPSTGSFRLTPRFWIVLGIAIVLIVAVVLAGVIFARAGNAEQTASDATTNTRPVPSDAPGAENAPQPPQTPSIDPNDARPRPADCAALFSSATTDQMDGYALNPEWSMQAEERVVGSTDSELASMLDGVEKLSCLWASPNGPGGVFIVTDFSWISDAEQQTVLARLKEVGYDCYDDLEGTRCTIDRSSAGAEIGESHFLREGVWIASRWADLAPNGYTRDIVTTTFG